MWAWKAGFDWALIDSLRLRVTRSRDVRAASLEERFDTTRGGVTVNNPYVLTNGQPTTQSGASFSGGNPDLAPEKADTWTAGFVFTPPAGVSIGDQFGSTTADIRPGNRLTFCNPVSKNGGAILDPATHLTCFRLLEPAGSSNVQVTIDNQFGDGQRLTVRRTVASRRICLPSTKTVLASPSGAFLDEAALP